MGRRGGMGRLGGWAALIALLLAALAPRGFMPGRGPDGGLTMVICSTAGPVEIGWPGEPAAEDRACDWALVAAALPPAPAGVASPRIAGLAPAPPAPEEPGARPERRPGAPRGPPSLS